MSRQAAEATIIRNMTCEILNSKSEFHQPSIVEGEKSDVAYDNMFGVETICYFSLFLFNLIIRSKRLRSSVSQKFSIHYMIRSQARNMS